MTNTKLIIIVISLAFCSVAKGQIGNNKGNKMQLIMPAIALVRIIDNGIPLYHTSGPISLNASNNNIIAGDDAKSLFPFTSNSLRLQYTYVPGIGQNGAKKAKITISRTSFNNQIFNTHTKFYITTSSGSYNTASSLPKIAGGGNSGFKKHEVKTNQRLIIQDIRAGWTGIGVTHGNEIIYSWELKNNKDVTALAGLSETITVTYTITEQ